MIVVSAPSAVMSMRESAPSEYIVQFWSSAPLLLSV